MKGDSIKTWEHAWVAEDSEKSHSELCTSELWLMGENTEAWR